MLLAFITGGLRETALLLDLPGWRDVLRCVCQHFYYNFYAIEETGILDVENSIQLFCLHLVLTEKIINSQQEFKEMFKNHRLLTGKGWTINQIWITDMDNEQNPLTRIA